MVTANLGPTGICSSQTTEEHWRPSNPLIQPRKPAKTAKSAKHKKKTAKIITRTAKPANLGPQRWSSQATQEHWRPSSLLIQPRKPAKTAKAAKHKKRITKITGRTAKPAKSLFTEMVQPGYWTQ